MSENSLSASRKFWSYTVLLVVVGLNLACSNLFLEMSDKTTDKAKFYAAKLKLDQSDWTGAIADILSMTADYQARREVKVVLASAYAGRCGLDFLDLAEKLQNAGATSFMSVLFNAFRLKTATNLADCRSAETVLKTIGATAARTSEENLLMAFVSLAKIGVILAIRADGDVDGVVDTNFSPCDSNGANGLADLPDDASATNYADTTEIATGFGLFMTSVAMAGAGDSAGDTWTELQANCATLEALGGIGSVCDNENRADVDTNEQNAMRAILMDNSNIGFAVDNTGTNNGNCAFSTCYTVNCAAY